MSSLKSILGKFADLSTLAGDGELTRAEIETLKVYLNRRRNKNNYLLFASSLLLVVGLIYIIVSSDNAEKMKETIGKSSVVGISIAGLITFMLNLWKENGNIRLMLIFVRSMDGAMLKAIVNKLWEKL
ncbi:hypothetical protein D3H65_04085 [Paraflavitalea soli]|uniref:Uncharacterized protein n=1 Tax=Paraflavitalea soli TaxID=2315862 RepID=A0A3B7MFU9_9BACT|nr:hypothetical protein [Paraflavitalea soli]AXY73202.1 hypothetical protein D3H65_04085 [Paraflavitalea soli]